MKISRFPLLVGLTLIISGVSKMISDIADTTENVAAILRTLLQIVVVVAPAVVHEVQLHDPDHAFLRLVLFIGLSLALASRHRGPAAARLSPYCPVCTLLHW